MFDEPISTKLAEQEMHDAHTQYVEARRRYEFKKERYYAEINRHYKQFISEVVASPPKPTTPDNGDKG